MPKIFYSDKPAVKALKRIFYIALGGLIIGFNINSFVRTGGLFPGGFSGLALLLQQIAEKYLGLNISFTFIYIPLNLFPVYIGLKYLGKRFTIYSLLVIIISSLVVDILPDVIITYDILLICIFGGVINGIAIWLCLLVGASAGGTDFISIYLSEKKGIDAWNYILIGNVVMLCVAGALFGFDRAMYSVIFQFCTTQVLNTLFKRYRKHTLFIITNQPSAVYGRIKTVTRHDATLFKGIGCFQGATRNMLYSVVSSDEVDKVIKEIKDVDPHAFINVMKTEQINGRFYKRPRD